MVTLISSLFKSKFFPHFFFFLISFTNCEAHLGYTLTSQFYLLEIYGHILPGTASSVEDLSLCKKFGLVRPSFESHHAPSLFHVRWIRNKCMTSRLQNKSERISQTRNLNQNYCCWTCNLWAKGNVARSNWPFDVWDVIIYSTMQHYKINTATYNYIVFVV